MKIYTAAGVVTLLFVGGIACQKKDKGPDNHSANVKSYIETVEFAGVATADTFNVSYDSQDRISGHGPASDPSNRIEYVYENDRYYQDIYKQGSLQLRNTFYLNSSRTFVDSSVEKFSNQATMHIKYLYNANEQLIEKRSYRYDGNSIPMSFDTVKYTYNADGLLDKQNERLEETIYKYDQVIKSNVHLETPYMPVKKQLPTQSVTTHNGAVVATINYTYTFDANNRLVKEKEAEAGDLFIITRSYTY
jgi:hypothetical protein